jgi:hypothetical protein
MREAGEQCIYRLQVTARSVLGALALNTGGLLIDSGWLRILGGGADGLPDLASVNGLGDTAPEVPPPLMEVGRDVLGGRFAINGGAFPGAPGQVHYFGPDTLAWHPLGMGHGRFVEWAMSGASAAFYESLRWTGWEAETSGLALDQGMSVYPPLFSAEGHYVQTATRRPVPWRELADMQEAFALELAELPPGSPLRLKITE